MTPLPRRGAVAAALFLATFLFAGAAAASASSLSGVAYKDLNRDAVRQTDEPVLSDQQIYLYDGGGAYAGVRYTDAAGQYSFTNLADGDYRVQYASPSWYPLRADWVPSTTGSVMPRKDVRVNGAATANFGWRPIGRSTTAGSPISAYTGPSGLRVESYNDVVSARDLHDAVVQGTVGEEAPRVTVRFDLGQTESTVAGWQGSPGSFTGYSAISYVSWISWLEHGDKDLSHEYGHAWSLYYDTMVQQSGDLSSYLKARGLDGDSRVNSSYDWSAREMIAEDYRQLLGSSTAQQAQQLNTDIPPASQVPGLRDWLLNTFTKAPATSAPASEPAPEAAPALAISGLAITPTPVTKSGTVSFSLSAPAAVTVTIETSTGGAVRTLLSNMARPSGQTSATWDRKNAAGQRVKAGSYRAVVKAVDSSGQTVTQSVTFKVS